MKIRSTVNKIKEWVTKHKLETLILVSIIVVSSILRLYNIRNTIVFLGDEGRDALAVKRIVMDLDPTLLGPTASVGGFYLGPVYYYMMAPFMILFGMDPVGAAVMVALMGISTVGLMYWFLRKLYGPFGASLVSLLYAVSPGIVTFSRSSWNPNPMPLFSLVTLVSFYKAITSKKGYWLVLVGIWLGIIIQLHYLGLIVVGTIGLMTLYFQPRNKWLKSVIAEISGFLIGASMYLAFELRHGFLNIKAVIEFISRAGSTTGPRSWNLFSLFFEINRFNIESVLGAWSASLSVYITLAFFVSLFAVLAFRYKTKQRPFSLGTKVILFYFLVAGFVLGMYRGQQYYHYFQLLYIAPYLVLGFVLSHLKHKKVKIVTATMCIAVSVYLATLTPTWQTGSRLLDQTERVSDAVLEMTDGQPYNFALIADGNSDHAYRFFLEINQQDPTPLSERVEEQLLVVCEKTPEATCAPLGNPLWEIAGFGRAEIADQQTVDPYITVYKMVHHESSVDMIGKPAQQGG